MSSLRCLRGLAPGRLAALIVVAYVSCLGAARAQDSVLDHGTDFAVGVERTWIGPAFWANRLQDWRLSDGRAVCVEATRRWPLRTLHLLTRRIPARPAPFQLTVRTGCVDPVNSETAGGLAGFLIGAGGAEIDHRLTALVHHRPAEDGGLLALVDAAGRVSFRDNATGTSKATWSIGGPLRDDELAPLPSTFSGTGRTGDLSAPIVLKLRGEPDGDGGWRLVLSATDAHDGALLSAATLGGVPPASVDGGLALVSHLGPEGGTAGHWFKNWTIAGDTIARHDERAWGPILSVQYTLGRGGLKLTAQAAPLGANDPDQAVLELRDADGSWIAVDRARFEPDSATFAFRVDDWDDRRERFVQYRIVLALATGDNTTRRTLYSGIVRREPTDADELVIASLNCHKTYTGGLRWNHDGVWFPHAELVDAVRTHEPDLLFFAGDQIYEGDLDPAIYDPPESARLDYLYKWYRWCWAFGELTRSIPTVTIPDDHDVYHGNLWGAGGRRALADPERGLSAQDSGGYKMSSRFVNMVHRTQTSHLPDAVDPAPIEQGISVYFTRLDWAGVSFAILADRQFKSSASVTVPEGQVVNGWFQADGFDPVTGSDTPGSVLLGERQLRFLADWSADWSGGTWMKTVLSQTLFCNVATIPEKAGGGAVLPSLPVLPLGEHPEDFKLAADTDSNGWPRSGRDRAVTLFRRAKAFHLAGDQHLGSLVQYGLADHRDAVVAFCSPAIANTWPRRWHPPIDGTNREPGAPEWTGDFRDGFGNAMTVWAVANPAQSGHDPAGLHDRMPGYGIVRLDRRSREIRFECWPRWVDPSDVDARQYPGWPRVFHQLDNDGRRPSGWLQRVVVSGMDEPVLQVTDESSGHIEWTWRIPGRELRPPVHGPGPYTLSVGEPGTARWREFTGLMPSASEGDALHVEF